MKSKGLLSLFAMIVFTALANVAVLQGQTSKFVTFDAPGAGDHDLQGTLATCINSVGTVTGYYLDSIAVSHGFVRDGSGNIVTFDAPGAGTNTFEGTFPVSINDKGVVTGYYLDEFLGYGHYRSHGFVRNSDGTIVTFDVAGVGPRGTIPTSINNGGFVAGRWTDTSNTLHAFLRNSNGTISVWTAPGAGGGEDQGTFPTVLAPGPTGTYLGYYIDGNSVSRGFLRDANGSFLTFAVPGAGKGKGQGTIPTGITAITEAIAGNYLDSNGLSHGFLNTDEGSSGRKITTFSVPGADKGTFPTAIVQGTLIGYYTRDLTTHGFLRNKGIITSFDVPNGETVNLGTYALSINKSGTIAGYFVDGYGVRHGFLRKP